MRLSLVLSEIYNKLLPEAERAKIQLDLDLDLTAYDTELIDTAEDIRAELEPLLEAAFHRAPHGMIKISAGPGKKVTIQDNGTTLSPTACALLSRGRVQAKSRVGFGTKIEIDLNQKP